MKNELFFVFFHFPLFHAALRSAEMGIQINIKIKPSTRKSLFIRYLEASNRSNQIYKLNQKIKRYY